MSITLSRQCGMEQTTNRVAATVKMTEQYHHEGPGGSLSSIMWQHDLQIGAVRRHTHAEGHEVGTMEVLNSYDRTLHPWMHGRRPSDIAARVKEWLG